MASSRKPGTAHLFNPQTPCKINVSETFYLKHHFDTHFDKTLKNQAFSPFFTPSKITTIPPKIPSNPWKISISSNSTENTIFNKEITHQNQSIYSSPTTQNTSKINTFQQYQVYKQHHFIEVINFIIKFILNLHQEFTQNNISLHYHLITNIITNIPYLQSLD